MKNPFEIYLTLIARFPKGKRFFNYLMALRPPGQKRQPWWTPARHLMVTLLVYVGATALGIWSTATLLDLATAAVA